MSWGNKSTAVTPAGAPVHSTTDQVAQKVVGVDWILSTGSAMIIFTNLLVATALVLLLRRKGGQSWCLVLNLAVADVLVGVAITGVATDVVQGTTASTQKSKCLLRMSFIIAPTASSILTMFLISLDRYVAIKCPLRYARLVGRRAIAGALVTLWLLSVAVGFLPCVIEQMQRGEYRRHCTFFTVIEPKSIIVLFAAFFFPLLCVFIFFYLDILKIACQHQRQIRRTQLTDVCHPVSTRYWHHVKALRTVALLVGCFTLSWCPFFVVCIVQVFCPTCQLYLLLENHLWFLGLSNSLINPLVYAFWQKEVRQQIRALFTCKIWLRRPGDGYETRDGHITRNVPAQAENSPPQKTIPPKESVTLPLVALTP
ncbi:glucose-dependent insulinotropic receptor [Chanos chanos]|uniref:Glucose-dependent insulinotropic receptor n=1 Tax=Chanos chanos TaxID=29144 RepID=A0A6J2WXV4_CHACN|nr:glucose-dependent insulinotropic receptor [Chanos chanos]